MSTHANFASVESLTSNSEEKFDVYTIQSFTRKTVSYFMITPTHRVQKLAIVIETIFVQSVVS